MHLTKTTNQIAMVLCGVFEFRLFLTRDVYHIESIISYQYHKINTSIVSKWQINDSFNYTFYDINIG